VLRRRAEVGAGVAAPGRTGGLRLSSVVRWSLTAPCRDGDRRTRKVARLTASNALLWLCFGREGHAVTRGRSEIADEMRRGAGCVSRRDGSGRHYVEIT